MAIKKMFMFELEPGMVVGEDVYRSNGVLLFPKNTMLNELMIAKLPLYNIMELPILDGPIEKTEIDIEAIVNKTKADMASGNTTPANEPKISYAEKLKSSEEFKTFTRSYDNAVSNINNKLSSFVSNDASLNVNELVGETLKLIEGVNTVHIFDMLQNMHTHDDSIYVHSMNVSLISATIGKWLNLSENDINNLTLAGLLHDLGKLSVPSEILNKQGKLTEEEYEIIKKHPMSGYDFIKNLPLDVKIKEACLLHHERCDGSGYPFKLNGNKISLYAKILAIADVYDAMTPPRTYREALCPFKAIELFEKEGLYKYDPKIIMTFLENIGASYLNNNVLLSDGSVGTIVMLNKLALSKPMLQVQGQFLDLSKHPELTIESII